MSLIKCSECHKDVSELADVCPSCGVQVVSARKAQIHEVATNHYISGLLFFGGIVWLAVAAYIGGAEEFAKDFRWARWVIAAGAVFYIISEVVRNLTERKAKKAQ